MIMIPIPPMIMAADPANDNGGHGAVAPASAGGALASLTALGTVLNKVDTASVAGRSGLPLLSFKARDNNGTWMFGQKKTIVEDGSKWAVNPTTFKWGFICFDNDNKPTERIVPVSQPKPNVAELPDTGFEWNEQWAVNMKCISGTDAGTEVTFKAATVGGVQAVAGHLAIGVPGLRGAVADGIGQHDRARGIAGGVAQRSGRFQVDRAGSFKNRSN